MALAVLLAGLAYAVPLDGSQGSHEHRRQSSASKVAFYPPASGGGSFISQSRERECRTLVVLDLLS